MTVCVCRLAAARVGRRASAVAESAVVGARAQERGESPRGAAARGPMTPPHQIHVIIEQHLICAMVTTHSTSLHVYLQSSSTPRPLKRAQKLWHKYRLRPAHRSYSFVPRSFVHIHASSCRMAHGHAFNLPRGLLPAYLLSYAPSPRSGAVSHRCGGTGLTCVVDLSQRPPGLGVGLGLGLRLGLGLELRARASRVGVRVRVRVGFGVAT